MEPCKGGNGGHRLEELDFLRCVLILLMVSFHLVYFGDTHPYAKQVVYTFHMPAFLIVSGYLMNVERTWRRFLKTLWWLAVPYAVMESGYVVMASVLPIREHIDQLSVGVFLEKMLLHPLGPYWYLHTIVLCGVVWYLSLRCPRLKLVSRGVLATLVLYLFSEWPGMVSFPHAMFFLLGAVMRHLRWPFLSVFPPSSLAVVAFGLLALSPDNLNCSTLGGTLMVWLAVSTCLFAYQLPPGRLRPAILFIGRNTLPIFLFSPLFTFLCKPLVQPLQFEPYAIVFLLVSLAVCIGGSLVVAFLLDWTGLSRLLVGRKMVLWH